MIQTTTNWVEKKRKVLFFPKQKLWHLFIQQTQTKNNKVLETKKENKLYVNRFVMQQ